MPFKRKIVGMWLIAAILPTAGFGVNAGQRLVEAVRNRDQAAVRALLQQRVNVNTPQGDGATALAWAAYWDDVETAGLLIHAGANANTANDLGVTPLSLACGNRSAAMVEKLLEAGANAKAVRETGETVLMTCSATGNLEAVKSLLARGAEINAKESLHDQTALMLAVARKHPDVAQALLDHGADVHARSKSGFTPLLFAAQQGDIDSVRILLAAGADVNEAAQDGMSVLLATVASGHQELTVFLLDHGANPNVADNRGTTALHYAVLKGLSIISGVQPSPYLFYKLRPNMPEIVKALLAHGANPNARLKHLPKQLLENDRPIGGATPFLLAAASADAATMRILAAGGADPLLPTELGTTPLMVAAGMDEQEFSDGQGEGTLEAVKVALELGGDVNAANVDDRSALHGAADTGADAVIKFLAEKGANVNVKDKYSQTPLSLAMAVTLDGLPPEKAYFRPRVLHQSTVDLLLKLGATPLTAPAVERADVSAAQPNQ